MSETITKSRKPKNTTLSEQLQNLENKKYHTVGTTHCRTIQNLESQNNTTLFEQLQNLESQKIPHCLNNYKI